jgi:hypothetical protein
MKQTKTNFELLIVIGVLIMVISLIGSSFTALPIMHEVRWEDKVFAQTSNEATPNLQFSYTKLGVLSGAFQRISYNSETKTLGLAILQHHQP